MRAISPKIPILLVSGYLSTAVVERARDAGASEVLQKPLSAHDLAAALDRLLRAARAAAERPRANPRRAKRFQSSDAQRVAVARRSPRRSASEQRSPRCDRNSLCVKCHRCADIRATAAVGNGARPAPFTPDTRPRTSPIPRRGDDDEHDHDQGRHADLLQGLGQRAAHRVPARLAAVGRRLGRADAVSSSQNGFRVIAHDRRGHGRSSQTATATRWTRMPTTWRELAAHLDLRNAILVGHSTGGGEVTRYVAPPRPRPRRQGRADRRRAAAHGEDPRTIRADSRSRCSTAFARGLVANRAQFYRDLPPGRSTATTVPAPRCPRA